jgi:hypothetical protein
MTEQAIAHSSYQIFWYQYAFIFTLYSIFLVLSHTVWICGAKTAGPSRKSLVFLKSNIFGSEKFQVSVHVGGNWTFVKHFYY